MVTFYKKPKVEYYFESENERFILNENLGKKIKFEFTNKFNCIECGATTKKLFGEGYCYQCFINSPKTEECILHPEKCQAHEGIARDMEYAKEHCLKPHYVYLAKTNHTKVGVTRQSQVPTRWIDQGADEAIILAKLPYRQIAGEVEVFFKQYYSDKTQWQAMLKNQTCEDDLKQKLEQSRELMPEKWKQYLLFYVDYYKFEYPKIDTPKEIESVKLEAVPVLEGILTAIKGQYLIFDNKKVINIRSHSGFNVEIIQY